MRFAAALLCLLAAPVSAAEFSLADLAFLEGGWRSDRDGFVIEETWSGESGGVVITNSRGVQNGAVRFLRFAIVEETAEGVVMRFKRFNPDYTT